MPKKETLYIDLPDHLYQFVLDQSKKYKLSPGRYVVALTLMHILTDPICKELHHDIMDSLFKMIKKKD